MAKAHNAPKVHTPIVDYDVLDKKWQTPDLYSAAHRYMEAFVASTPLELLCGPATIQCAKLRHLSGRV